MISGIILGFEDIFSLSEVIVLRAKSAVSPKEHFLEKFESLFCFVPFEHIKRIGFCFGCNVGRKVVFALADALADM